MCIEQVRRFVLFVVLLLVQGLVLNHIHLFDCATPLIYIILCCIFAETRQDGRLFSGAFPSDSVLMSLPIPQVWQLLL